ncbi:hypothetical protein [Spiroplasma endosymbiont of Danaus chrysippus]|uniref:hypothetical protein n=1 Tax=Spiroplasma endosymbiont of Danaus chrysippus TaxID=2691041 RepID=UPI0013C68129|nr:hypothetical protein [Spiroplasma endosymbiont of Danaus chrysippus]CAB1054650.1 hypothetical protein [Spiroplasma endosymbiont of Danaus chrysippus]
MSAQQQQQPSKEIFDKLQGEKDKKEKANTSSGGGSRNWIVKIAKDVTYISFFPYIWLKKLLVSLFNNRTKKPKLNQSVNIIKNKDNVNQKNNVSTNSNGQVSFKEVDALDPENESVAEALNLNGNATNPFQNVAHSCNREEIPLFSKTTSGKKLTT